MELSKDCLETKTLCDKGKLWAKKSNKNDKEEEYLKRGNIYMIEKTSNGTWMDNNSETIDSLEMYEDVNNRVEH